ncbi:MAG: DUF2155 domain-containing protein [Rickettsiaceae bacterium]|nr:DUF2155 domain-containing protein [Rickettsiaceae bacterium]
MKYITAFFILFYCFNYSCAEQITSDEEKVFLGDYKDYTKAEVIILNKITAKSEKKILEIGQLNLFKNLSLNVKRCVQWEHHNISEYLAYIVILDQSQGNQQLFNGWLFSNNLSVNSFQHPVLEVIMVRCVENLS